jgi:CRP/FNR family cyclic AMP-dependent transcriptional regulator
MAADPFDQVRLFQALSPAQRTLLRPLVVICEFAAGEKLFGQGDPAEYLYLVASGEVLIRYKPDDGPVIVLARVRQGGVVGWSAALGNHVYTSEAECAIEAQLLRLRGKDLRLICQMYPDLGACILELLADMISERLRSPHEQIIELLKQGMQSGINDH